jgi:hypothetical protein
MSPEDQQLIPQALELMKDKPLRNFRIEVAADSLVQIDENQMKQDRLQFLQTFGGFFQQSMPVVQNIPELAPMMVELMKFGISAFKQSRQIEGTLDVALDQIKQSQGQPRPNPEAEQAQAAAQAEQGKAQMQMQMEQSKMQLEQAKLQQQMQIEQMKAQNQAQLEQMKQQFEAQMQTQEAQQRQDAEKYKADLDAATKIMVARIGNNTGPDMLAAQQAASDKIAQDLGQGVREALANITGVHEGMANMHGAAMDRMGQVMDTLKSPKRIVRGQDGRAIGVESIEQAQQLPMGIQ